MPHPKLTSTLNQTALISLIACTPVLQAIAFPSTIANCSHVEAKLHLNSPLGFQRILWDSTCTRAYIPPPSFGSKAISPKVVTSAGLRECPRLFNIQDAAGEMDKIRVSEARKIANKSKLQELESARSLMLAEEIMTANKNKTTISANLQEGRKKLSNAQDSLTNVKLERQQCLENCTDLDAKLLYYETEVNTLTQSIREQERIYSSIDRDIKDLERRKTESEGRIKNFATEITELNQSLNEITKGLDEMIGGFYGRYGATITLKMDLPWDQQIQALNSMNSGKGVVFARLPIHESKMSIVSFDPEYAVSTGSPILNRNFANLTFKENILEATPPAPQVGLGNMLLLPSVNFDLSLYGACPIANDDLNGLDPEKIKNYDESFSAVVSYFYTVEDDSGVSISFNQHQALNRIIDHFKASETLDLNALTTNFEYFLPQLRIDAGQVFLDFTVRTKILAPRYMAILQNLVRLIASPNFENQALETSDVQKIKFKRTVKAEELDQHLAILKGKLPELYNEQGTGKVYYQQNSQINY